jgi:hypothetical protein
MTLATRRPERTLLYRTVQTHLETWLAHRREGHDDYGPVPAYVEREFRRYLEYGILAEVLRGRCGHDLLIACSCKGRGVFPSCNARRTAATAAHLTDHILPDLPLRVWMPAAGTTAYRKVPPRHPSAALGRPETVAVQVSRH